MCGGIQHRLTSLLCGRPVCGEGGVRVEKVKKGENWTFGGVWNGFGLVGYTTNAVDRVWSCVGRCAGEWVVLERVLGEQSSHNDGWVDISQ